MKRISFKRWIAHTLTIGIIVTSLFPGGVYAAEVEEKVNETNENLNQLIDENEELTTDVPEEEKTEDTGESTILLSTDAAPTDTFGAVAVEQLAGVVKLVYASSSEAKKAYDTYVEQGYVVEYDTTVTMIDDTKTPLTEVNTGEVEVSEIETVEDLLTEEVEVESEQVRYSKVAVIDTGCDLAAIPGRIAEGTDTAITDVNGHGTLMAEIIASQTTDNVKILPIKAFDDNGISTVAQVCAAIQTACNMGVDVINLSMAGEGHSTMLANAINHATSQGITVVVSAGNEASDVGGFMPGNIDSAITVSATNKNEVFAEYSNFGEKIDFSAVGEIIKDQGTEDTSDDLYYEGTSIAAAFVSGYAACIKDNNQNADVNGTFLKYAKDLGDVGKDIYYGNGFLTLENIAFDVNKDNSSDNENTSDEEKVDNKEEDEDEKQDIEKENEDEKDDGKQELKIAREVDSLSELRGAFLDANSGNKDVPVKLTKDITITDEYAFQLNNNKLTINGAYKDKNGNQKKHHITIKSNNSKTGSDYFKKYAYCMGVTNGATLELKNVVIDASNLYPNPGTGNAVVTVWGGNLIVSNCIFTNVSSGGIGAINVIEGKGGTLTVKNTTIKDSSATGGVCAWTNKNNVTCENVNVEKGIGISFQVTGSDDGTATMTNCKANETGAGFLLQGMVTLNNCDALNSVNRGFDIKGKSGSTATDICADGSGENGIYNQGNITLKKGVVSKNNKGYGVTNKATGTIDVLGGEYYGNSKSGLINSGEATIKKGLFYNNTYHGIRNSKKFTVSPSSEGAVKCYLNKKSGLCNTGKDVIIDGGWFGGWTGGEKNGNIEYGIHNTYDTDDNGKVTSFGTIYINGSGVKTVAWYNNKSGIFNDSYNPKKKTEDTAIISYCDIRGNTEYGVINKATGTIAVLGGNYYSNGKSGLINSGKATIKNGLFHENNHHGIRNSKKLTVSPSSEGAVRCYLNKKSGLCNTGNATIEGGWFGGWYKAEKNGNTEHGIYNCYDTDDNERITAYGRIWIYGSGAETVAWYNGKSGIYNKSYNPSKKTDVTATINYCDIRGNTEYGIYNNGGATKFAGGTVYSNQKAGVLNKAGTFNMTRGTIKDNDDNGSATGGNKVPGIQNEAGATVNISSGTVSGNSYGLHNKGPATINDCDIKDNTYGIYNNGGVATFAGGEVHSNTQKGIYNKTGTFTMSGGTVKDNSDGIYNLGSATITKATIQSNANGIVNEKSGTTTIGGETKSDVAIQNNTYGVLNTAENNGVTIGSASIRGNTTADLGQSGETMKMSGKNTNTNIIELGVGSDGKPEIVTIDGVPVAKKLVVIKSDTGTMTAQQITDNMTIERPMFYCINATPSAVLTKLAFNDSAQKTLVKGTKRPAVMRPGNGKNGADKTHIVLSTKYLATYKVNDIIEGFEFSVPNAVALFWKEDVNIDSLPKLMAKVDGVLSEFPILGWLKDGIGKIYEVGASMLFGSDETQKDHEIVAKMGLCNLVINGNGQSEGEDYVIEEFNCVTDKLPKNTFKKEFKDDYYYIELGEQKQHETKFSYQGWSLSKDANYLSNGVIKPQGKLDFADVAAYMKDHKDTLTYGDNGLPNIPIYAVWDQYPELEAEDISIVSSWIDEKTDAELSDILYENVVGTDKEDGDPTKNNRMENGVKDKGVICTDFDKVEIQQLKHTGSVTITYQATDGVGNVTERKVRVYVNSANPLEPFDPDHPEKGGVYLNRARCINKEYYEVGKVSVGLDKKDEHYLDGYKKGGLMPNDLWYTNQDYVDVITEAFDNMEKDEPEITWKFTHEQVLETQEWIEEHGFGNSEEKDGLKKYYEKYEKSITRPIKS